MLIDEIYGQFEEHVKTGDIVWCAGDIIERTKKVVVGPSRHDTNVHVEHSYEAVNAFWNKTYFDNYEDAERVCHAINMEYTDWLYSAWR